MKNKAQKDSCKTKVCQFIWMASGVSVWVWLSCIYNVFNAKWNWISKHVDWIVELSVCCCCCSYTTVIISSFTMKKHKLSLYINQMTARCLILSFNLRKVQVFCTESDIFVFVSIHKHFFRWNDAENWFSLNFNVFWIFYFFFFH